MLITRISKPLTAQFLPANSIYHIASQVFKNQSISQMTVTAFSYFYEMKKVFLFLIILLIPFYSREKGSEVSEKEAIKLAEDFIRCNGYTQEPIDTSKQKLSFTLNENMLFQAGYANLDSVIKNRRNSLYPKAKYILYNDERKAWEIGFVSTKIPLNELDTCDKERPLIGSTVIVENYHLRISHLNPILKFFKKLS